MRTYTPITASYNGKGTQAGGGKVDLALDCPGDTIARLTVTETVGTVQQSATVLLDYRTLALVMARAGALLDSKSM